MQDQKQQQFEYLEIRIQSQLKDVLKYFYFSMVGNINFSLNRMIKLQFKQKFSIFIKNMFDRELSLKQEVVQNLVTFQHVICQKQEIDPLRQYEQKKLLRKDQRNKHTKKQSNFHQESQQQSRQGYIRIEVKNRKFSMRKYFLVVLFIIFFISMKILINKIDIHLNKNLSKNLEIEIQSQFQRVLIKQQETQLNKSGNSKQWLQQEQTYHIVSKINARFALDVVQSFLGQKHLSMYEWGNLQSQKFYLQNVQGNFFHIISAQSGLYMQKSSKTIQGLNKVKFQAQKGSLWQLVPVNQFPKNAFYILSQEQNKSLSILNGYADNAVDLVISNWTKSDNQIWYFRKEMNHFLLNQTNKQKYQEKVSSLLFNITKDTQQKINECISLQQIKQQMKAKNMQIPLWMNKPQIIDHQTEQKIFQNPLNLYGINERKSFSSNQIEKQNFQIVNIKTLYKKFINFLLSLTNLFSFKPKRVNQKCAQNHTVAYIWYSDKQMPQEYKRILTNCKNNTRLLTQKDFIFFVQKWNQIQPNYPIQTAKIPIRQRINMLKLLYLFFESGIYADFDTEIDEQCFGNAYADDIIFTNRMDENLDWEMTFNVQQIIVPEENFMMIRTKEHPQVRRMLQQEIMEQSNKGGQRWRECLYRQCLILQCQQHYRDNTYKRGFD